MRVSLEYPVLGNEESIFTWWNGTWLCNPVDGDLEIAWMVHREAIWDWIASVRGTARTQRGWESHAILCLWFQTDNNEKIVGEDLRGKGGPGLQSRLVPELGTHSGDSQSLARYNNNNKECKRNSYESLSSLLPSRFGFMYLFIYETQRNDKQNEKHGVL